MKLIMNGVNGGYLRDILEAADSSANRKLKPIERVDAAVAYATNDDQLFNWCWNRKIPLRFWGRFDNGVPVSIPVLERFLQRKSANYTCKLVRHFHPKVIWWRGYGAYIGSANLSDAAWYKNFEAGVFIDEVDLAVSGQAAELEAFFRMIDARSSPLTDELFGMLKSRSQFLDQKRNEDRDYSKLMLDTNHVQKWDGLSVTTKAKAMDAARSNFLNEWNSTLQIMRDLAEKVSVDANRPTWVGKDVPHGAQADQFLHAHYYQRTFDGRRAMFEDFYLKSAANPEAAIDDAINWWRSLPTAPENEDTMLNEKAPYLRKMLSNDRLPNITEAEFVEVLSRVHAATDYARRISNKAVNLAGDRPYSVSEKIDALARHIYRGPLNGAPSPLDTLSYVLHGGSIDELPVRLWHALHDSKLRIDNMGISTLGEIVGWAFPDRFPPRNGRTSKALRSLGFDVMVHV